MTSQEAQTDVYCDSETGDDCDCTSDARFSGVCVTTKMLQYLFLLTISVLHYFGPQRHGLQRSDYCGRTFDPEALNKLRQ